MVQRWPALGISNLPAVKANTVTGLWYWLSHVGMHKSCTLIYMQTTWLNALAQHADVSNLTGFDNTLSRRLEV